MLSALASCANIEEEAGVLTQVDILEDTEKKDIQEAEERDESRIPRW